MQVGDLAIYTFNRVVHGAIRKFMRTELYQPQLSDRNNRQDWEKEGAKSAQARATEIVGEILEKPEIPVLSSEIRTEIRKEIPGLKDGIM